MNIVVSEYVCGGGWPTPLIPKSLRVEGAAMLQAVIEDLAQLPDLQVFTTWDRRLSHPPQFEGNVHRQLVNDTEAEVRHFSRLCETHQIDAALVIAPEIDGILKQRCAWWRASETPLLNAGADSLHLAGDKWLTYQLCRQSRIPTIETRLATDFVNTTAPWFPCIAKLRDGAGSQEMQLITTSADWDQFRQRPDLARFLLQPFVAGRSLSVSAIIDHGRFRCLFPVGEQRFVSPTAFEYAGGCIPAQGVDESQILSLVKQAVTVLTDLHGYVGFDLLLPHGASEGARLMEINPRLTTAYIGYRVIASQNLSQWLLNPGSSSQPEFHGAVTFHAHGRIESRS